MALPERSEIPEEHKWDLSPLFKNVEQWEKALEKIEKRIPEIGSYRGRLSSGNDVIADLIRTEDSLERDLEKVYTYAHLRYDEDLRDPGSKTMNDRARMTAVRLEEETSYVAPEILSMDDERLITIMEDPLLEFARVPLREIVRRKEHFLSDKEERLLSMAEETLSTPAIVFNMLNDADLTFPSIIDSQGEEVEVTHGRYTGFLLDGNRRVRKDAFDSLYSSYRSHRNTFCASLEGDLKRRSFNARARSYRSALEASLDGDEVPVEVYLNLIQTIRKHMGDMFRYVSLRKKILGVDELHMYDVYVPLIPDFEREIPYEEAEEIVLTALKPLGDEILEIVGEAYRKRWIDRYENRGKRSGAYSSGCYDSPPYILMNYDGRVKDLFTLAHEMGHSVHTYLSNRNQPHITADYRIFIAEVASTVNEVLLLSHLTDQWRSKEAQAYLTNHHLEGFKGTVFRQTMFAEFEYEVARKVEERVPLTPDLLSDLYGKLNEDYFGPEMIIDDNIRLEWARIPHFYYNFYVYKYATGYCSATAIARSILEGKGSLDRYVEMLKSGSTKPPLELLKGAGVDLTTSGPIDSALDLFGELVTRMEGVHRGL